MQVKLSEILRRHLNAASCEAARSGNPEIIAGATLLSILRENSSHAAHVLGKLLGEKELCEIRLKLERWVRAAGETKSHTNTELAKTLADIVIGITGVCSRMHGQNNKGKKKVAVEPPVAGTGHFLVWLLQPGGPCGEILGGYGIDAERAEQLAGKLPSEEDFNMDMKFIAALGAIRAKRAEAADRLQEEDAGESRPRRRGGEALGKLARFGVSLTAMAREGRIDPVVGRDGEIGRVVQILGRRKKNNPILIGEAGVGKSAIVEGLALKIVSGDVPAHLAGKEVFSLDMASLVAGTKYRGEFEQRIKELISLLARHDNVILFIDEIHTIAGAGSTQGSLDTANILKPALARGDLQCIGASTLDEYREHIERDGALERRFQKIVVEPPTEAQTLEILRSIKGDYETHHGVVYTDAALRACVDLTGRYLSDRCFPDKAIDALDEAGSKARLSCRREPVDIAALAETIDEAEERLEEAGEGITKRESAQARARIRAMKQRLEEFRACWRRENMLSPVTVDAPQIEEVITAMTGIPVERISQDDRKRLANLGGELSSAVVGQPQAVERVVRSVVRSRTGLKDPDKPAGVFMFVGPTGMGKTHLARELSRLMFDRRDALIRIDMSEYSEKHNVSRMIGSPPGYVGYGEGGQLTEAVRRQPYSVVLFDEIEKAHPDVFNIMLQIFDDGQLTDGNGRKVDFRNTVIVMTSNVGSRRAAARTAVVGYATASRDAGGERAREQDFRSSLESAFAPEFINRIDDIVVFNTLSPEDVRAIAMLELNKVVSRAKTLGITLKAGARAGRLLAEKGYDSRYGVRALKRAIRELVEVPLSHMLATGQAARGDTLRIEAGSDRIEIRKTTPALARTS